MRITSALGSIAVLLFSAVSGRAIAQTQAAMTEAACNKLKNAETVLGRVYEQVLKTTAADTNFGKAFREAHSAWMTFREAHVLAIYPDPDPKAYGTAYSMCRCGVLEQMTIQRTRELRRVWIDGIEEGDVCTGSCAIKPAAPNRRK